MNKVMQKTRDWYEANRDRLLPRYNGKYLVLADGAVAGDFETQMDAIREASKTRKKGTFFVHKCVPAPEEFACKFVNVCFN